MGNSQNPEFIDNEEISEPDRADQLDCGELQDSSSVTVGSGAAYGVSSANAEADRVTDIHEDEEDGDLLLSQNCRPSGLLQWLQALDLQVIGACRADERLKPLLKLNVSTGAAEDRLLAHLNQHFEAAEVGILARCLCIPLVSIRVGKIMERGSMLCPTGARGNLNLVLLPTSDLRISFTGDDGSLEKLAVLHSIGRRSAVTIDQIAADSSGRSFILKVMECRVFYFWCSEKSKLLGDELLSKMKDLLQRSPSLADLTGICESRLSSFAAHIRGFVAGSAESNPAGAADSSAAPLISSPAQFEEGQNALTSAMSCSQRARHNNSQQSAKTNSLSQGILSPRSCPFKEGGAKNVLLRSSARDKIRRRGDCYLSSVEEFPFLAAVSGGGSVYCDTGKSQAFAGTLPCSSGSGFLDKLGKSVNPPSLGSSHSSTGVACLFSPYYCWCPPRVPPLQYTVTPPQQQMPSGPLSLPPLLSPFSTSPSRVSGLLTPVTPLGLPIPFPPPRAQQMATFKPLMCDSIVHVPVIDVCSSGYLVSGGSAISTTIPPLHSRLVSSADSVVDKGARETLRLLISTSSAQNSAQLMEVLPAVLTSRDDKQGLIVAGSRGLYEGSQDVGVLASGIAAVGLGSFPDGSLELLAQCSVAGHVEIPPELPAERVTSSSEVGQGSPSPDRLE